MWMYSRPILISIQPGQRSCILWRRIIDTATLHQGTCYRVFIQRQATSVRRSKWSLFRAECDVEPRSAQKIFVVLTLNAAVIWRTVRVSPSLRRSAGGGGGGEVGRGHGTRSCITRCRTTVSSGSGSWHLSTATSASPSLPTSSGTGSVTASQVRAKIRLSLVHFYYFASSSSTAGLRLIRMSLYGCGKQRKQMSRFSAKLE